ncbi:MAG TPA: DUF6502 family protein [Steroidobacteraceae bacterium]|jgi:hypothetical protein|nr:DUF6502 family protein [Steroidobacteraceae bacterium]
MSDSLKAAVNAAILRMLSPLVRLLLAAGVGVGDFMAIVKVAYVRAARDEGRERRGEVRPNASRIAVVTGLTRGEVAAMLSEDSDERRTSDRGRHRAERVLAGWWNDPDFQTPDREPAVLPISGSRRSFKELVKRYSNEPRVTPILDELLRVNAVKRLSDGTLKAVSRTYATVRWNPDGIASLGEQLAEHCGTLLHNLEHPGEPRLVRRIVNAQLDPRYRPMLVRDIQEELEATANSIDDALNERRATVTPVRGGRQAVRLGVVMYVFEEPVILEPATSEKFKKAAGGRQRRRQSGRTRS